jgi:hypothetical protein
MMPERAPVSPSLQILLFVLFALTLAVITFAAASIVLV